MHDRDVRAAVRDRLSTAHQNDPNTRIVEEMGVWSGTVRIDVAVINGELCGFELKSDSDTLLRLSYQAEIYGKVFDRVTLVVGSKHYDDAIARIPPWWGCIVATMTNGEVVLRSKRKAKRNPAPDPLIVAQLLWKAEALAVLETFGLARGWRSKSVKAIHQRLAAQIPFVELGNQVRSALTHRADWLGQDRSDKLDMPVHSDLHPML